MRDAAPQTIYLADYTPYGFIIDDVALHFDLDPRKTRVKSRISFRPNPDASDKTFFLHGENLSLVSAAIDGTPVLDIKHHAAADAAIGTDAFDGLYTHRRPPPREGLTIDGNRR